MDSEFEVLEFYGDSVLYEKLSNLLLKTRRFLKPGLLTKMRSHCVCNNNLAICYVNLKMEQLLKSDQIPCTTKGQADVMESILGELSEKIESGKNAELKTFLEALIGYILYTGEKNYFLNEQRFFIGTSNGSPANLIERNKSGGRKLSPQSKFPQHNYSLGDVPLPHHFSLNLSKGIFEKDLKKNEHYGEEVYPDYKDLNIVSSSKTSKGTPPPKATLPLPPQSKVENPFTIRIPVPDPPTWQDLLNWSNSK